jgi:hypothetical protein
MADCLIYSDARLRAFLFQVVAAVQVQALASHFEAPDNMQAVLCCTGRCSGGEGFTPETYIIEQDAMYGGLTCPHSNNTVRCATHAFMAASTMQGSLWAVALSLQKRCYWHGASVCDGRRIQWCSQGHLAVRV